MKHILFIDELEKLNIRKDSSLLLALKLKDAGIETYLLFKSELYYRNKGSFHFSLTSFSGQCFEGSYYIERFELEGVKKLKLEEGDVIHMRLDPPFDSRYLRYLWLLSGLENQGIRVLNSPAGIMNHNEKLYAYQQRESLASFVGESLESFSNFIDELNREGKYSDLIMKPLDLFQGIGVEKFSLSRPDLSVQFKRILAKFKGPVIVQPFDSSVEKGEVRTIYYKGEELGTILKTPAKGEFLANIASGATYQKTSLTTGQRNLCERISDDLLTCGVEWIAFDLLGDFVSEVNITCPGLLVEVAQACGNDLIGKFIELVTSKSLLYGQ